jgi:MscS family membrane protein
MTEQINELAPVVVGALDYGNRLQEIALIFLAGGFAVLAGLGIVFALRLVLTWLAPESMVKAYMRVVLARQGLVLILFTFAAMDIMLFLLPDTEWLTLLEFFLSAGIGICGGWGLSRLFQEFFNTAIVGAAFESNPKVRGESIFLLRYLGDFAIAIVVLLIFCINHDINVLGIVASLGIGGLAVAFAAQKTLEQFLGGIVLTLDRPFTVGDYIGLSDGQQGKQGTFGRVESIGLRSTKIRTSGKGTLTIIPNNSLTQSTIENFSGAKKEMSVMTLEFPKALSANDQAIIRQTIMDSTMDIFGLDWRSTEVTFGDDNAQISFFILGSNELSMELRRQLLDLATQKITKQLLDQDITFVLNQPTIYVDSPISL